MHNKRVLITGGAGLIGSHIADLVVAEGAAEVVILDNFSRGRMANLQEAQSRGRVTIAEGDIRDRQFVRSCLEGIDVVFHQAAIRITQCAEDPRLALEVLADGTFNLLESAVAAGVQKVVAASSASVYGLAEQFPTPERHHGYNNGTIYGAAKMFNEGLLRSFHQMYGLPCVALRYFNVYGPRMDCFGAYTEVLIRWMEAVADEKAPCILGDGTQTMDFLSVEDVAWANLLAAKSNVVDDVFNVASGVETSLSQLAALLTSVMGRQIAPTYGPARRVNGVTRRLADTSKAERAIGFRAQIPLEEGLRRLVRWWQQERALQEPALRESAVCA